MADNPFGFLDAKSETAPIAVATAPPTNNFDFLDQTPKPSLASAVSEPTAGAGGFSFLDEKPAPQQSVTKPPDSGGIDEPWYKRAWNWANTPLIDNESFEKITGVHPTSGWGKGVEDLLTGFTSPLSLALFVGTLPIGGEGGLIGALADSGGAAALRAAGMGAEDIATTVRGSKVFSQAVKNGFNEAEAWKKVEEAGIAADKVKQGLQTIKSAGIADDSLTASGPFRRMTEAWTRNIGRPMGITPAQAQMVGRGVQLLSDAGFAGMNIYSAAQISPRFLDALKEGDYETAERLGFNLAGSGLFGYWGARQTFHESGALMDEGAAAAGLKMKPTDEIRKILDLMKPWRKRKVLGSQEMKQWEEGIRNKYPDFKPDDWSLAEAWRITGGDKNEMARWYNAVLDSAGRDDVSRLPVLDASWSKHEQMYRDFAAQQGFSQPFAKLQPDQQVEATTKAEELKATDAGLKQVFTRDVQRAFPNIPSQQAEAGRILLEARARAQNLPFSELLKKLGVQFEYGGNFSPEALLQENPLSPEAIQKENDWFNQAKKELGENAPISKILDRAQQLKDEANKPERRSQGVVNQIQRTAFDVTKKAGLPRINFQTEEGNVKGSAEFLEDGGAVIRGFKSGDVSTLVHELSHVLRRNLDSSENVLAEKAYGVEKGQWTRDHEENFARDFEKYLSEGKSPVPQMNQIFGKLKVWLKTIYDKIMGSPLSRELSPEKKQLFDKILGGDISDPEREMQELVQRQELRAKPPEYVDKMLGRFDPSRVQDKHIQAAKEIGKRLDENGERAQQSNILGHLLEDYAPQFWKDPENESIRKFVTELRTGNLAISTSMARHRLFKSQLEGLLAGYEPHDSDFVSRAAFNGRKFEEIAANRQFLDNLQDQGVRASDFRPLVAPATGSAEKVDGPNGENSALLVNPRSVRNIRISDKNIQDLKNQGQFDALLRKKQIVKWGDADKFGNQHYAWNTEDYRTLDHPSFRKWFFAGHDPGNNPAYVKTDLRVHPDAYEYLKKQFQQQSDFAKSRLGKGLLGAGREAKGTLLFISPFHAVQEGLRAIMTGISPIGVEKFDPNNEFHRLAAAYGVMEGTDYKNLSDYEEGRMVGHSKIIGKTPILRDIQNKVQGWMFEKYIPGLKLRAFSSLFERFKSSHPEWTEDKSAQEAANETNARFGGIDWKAEGRNIGLQDAFRVFALAPDWLESEIRTMARLFTPEGNLTRQDVGLMVLKMYAAFRVLNYLTSGKPHNEAPFGLAIKGDDGKEKVYSVRTLPTDMLHAATDPINFLKGRTAPLVRTAEQLYSGRDEFGRKMPTHSMVTDLLRNASPIPVQTAFGAPKELTGLDQALKASGATVTPYRTEAQKLASQISSDHSENGVIPENQLKRHALLIQWEDEIRGGKRPVTDIYKMAEDGAIPVKDAKAIIKNVEETKELKNPDMAHLYTRASRLPASDFVRVWELSTPAEKAVLAPLMVRKRQQYYKKVWTEMTPAERSVDPTYRFFRRMFPNESPL